MQITHEDMLATFKQVGYFEAMGRSLNAADADARLYCSIKYDTPSIAGLYAWVVNDGAGRTIYYVGKTSRSIAERHKDHRGGFRYSIRGKTHRDILLPLIRSGATIEIWGYHPPEVQIGTFGEVNVVSSIEDHLLKHLTPRPEGNFKAKRPKTAA